MTPEDLPSLDGLAAYVRTLYASHWPDHRPALVIIHDEQGREHLRLPIPRLMGACSHSLDFRSVVWFGTAYRLSATQAACLAILWAAWESGCPEVGQAALLEGAGSEARRIRDVFKGAAIWDDGVIAPAGKGSFRLYTPNEIA